MVFLYNNNNQRPMRGCHASSPYDHHTTNQHHGKTQKNPPSTNAHNSNPHTESAKNNEKKKTRF